MSAGTTYFLQETKSSTNLLRLKLIKELMHSTGYCKRYLCFLNVLNCIYQHNPNLNVCYKTLPPLVTLVTIRLQRICNKLFKRISLLSIYMRRQVFLRVLKFFEKGHTYCFFLNILSEAAIERCPMVSNLEKYILRTSIFKYQYCRHLKRIKASPYSKNIKKN